MLNAHTTRGTSEKCDKTNPGCMENECNQIFKDAYRGKRKGKKYKYACGWWTLQRLKDRHERDAMSDGGCYDDCPDDPITALGILKEIGMRAYIEDGKMKFEYYENSLPRMFARYKELAIKKYKKEDMSNEEQNILAVLKDALKDRGFHTHVCLIDEIDCKKSK